MKRKRFILLTFLLIISRVCDAATTALYTPRLDHETNLLVKYLHFGWPGVIISQIALVGLVIGLLYYWLYRYHPVYPVEKGLDLKEFVSYLNFNNTHSFFRVFYLWPVNSSTFWASTAYVASHTLITAGFAVAGSTTLLLLAPAYKTLYALGIPYLLYLLIILFAVYFTVKFYKTEYAKYRLNNRHL